MTLLGWISAAAVGLMLGLLGSGGSILTVPALVFFVHHTDKTAITASLAIVGAVATVGSVLAAARHTVDWRSVVLFAAAGVPSTTAGTWLGRFAAPGVQLATFAVVLLAAAYFTLRAPQAEAAGPPTCQHCAAMIALQGAAVGLLTGFVGVGGGFLIVPALLVLGGLSMRQAVGSSLVIVALNSWVGFATHLSTDRRATLGLDWSVIVAFIAVGSVGSLLGQFATGRLPQAQLKRLFGVFLVLVGALVLWRSVPQVF